MIFSLEGCLPYCLVSLLLFSIFYLLSYSVFTVLSSAQNCRQDFQKSLRKSI